MPDTFCALAFRQLQVRPSGKVTVCCLDRGDGGSVYRDRVSELWNSERMRGMRRALASGEEPADCAGCFDMERAGSVSLRQASNLREGAPGLVAVERLAARSRARDFHVAEGPSQLLLETGNVCNLKCRMCNGTSSSAIQADPVHRAWSGAAPEPAPIEPRFAGPWYKQQAFLSEELLAGAGDLTDIQLIGGETLMSSGGLMVLRDLVRRGLAEGIRVALNTNGTWIDEDWLEILGRFRQSTLAISLDGVGALNDYIRYPSRYDEILAHLPRFRGVPRATVMVTGIFQAYNALDFWRVLALCDELDVPLWAFPLQWPPHLAVAALPPSARALSAERLRRQLASRRASATLAGAQELVTLLESLGDGWDRDLARTFMEFTNDLDRDRGQSLAAVAPELIQHFADAGFPWEERVRHAALSRRAQRPRPAPQPATQPATQPAPPAPPPVPSATPPSVAPIRWRAIPRKLVAVSRRVADLAVAGSPEARREVLVDLGQAAARFVSRARRRLEGR